MNLGEALLVALDRAAADGWQAEEPSTPTTEVRGRLARMAALEKEHGGAQGAAAAAGVQLRTWKSWARRTARPTAASMGKLRRAASSIYRRAAVRRALRARQPVVAAVVSWNGYIVRWNDGHRTVNLDQLGRPTLSQLVQPWAEGDTEELAARFEAATRKAYGVPVLFLGDEVEVRFQ